VDAYKAQDCATGEFADHGAYVLLGEAGSFICAKIGMSSFLQRRIAAVCSISPFTLQHAIILGTPNRQWARTAEGALHRLLRKFRSRGEWFLFEPGNATHKAALHTAINAVQALYELTRVTVNVPALLKCAASIRSDELSERRMLKRESKEYRAKMAVVHCERRAAECADRAAVAATFEAESRRQIAIALNQRQS